MPPGTATAEELARRLFAASSASEGEPDATAMVAACDRLSVEFSRWLGVRGYEALLSRTLVANRLAHPALELIRYEQSDSGLKGVDESIEHRGAEATARALEALLESVLSLCIRLIGADLVATLVEKSMKQRTNDELRARDNLNQGARSRGQE